MFMFSYWRIFIHLFNNCLQSTCYMTACYVLKLSWKMGHGFCLPRVFCIWERRDLEPKISCMSYRMDNKCVWFGTHKYQKILFNCRQAWFNLYNHLLKDATLPHLVDEESKCSENLSACPWPTARKRRILNLYLSVFFLLSGSQE